MNIVASWTDSAGHRISRWIIFFPVSEAVLKKTNAQDVFERTFFEARCRLHMFYTG